MSAKKVNVCGHCAGAPRNKWGAFLAHTACQIDACACRQNGHVVTPEIAAVQRAYTRGPAESDWAEGDRA